MSNSRTAKTRTLVERGPGHGCRGHQAAAAASCQAASLGASGRTVSASLANRVGGLGCFSSSGRHDREVVGRGRWRALWWKERIRTCRWFVVEEGAAHPAACSLGPSRVLPRRLQLPRGLGLPGTERPLPWANPTAGVTRRARVNLSEFLGAGLS